MALIRCPDCREKFQWDITKYGYPDVCPNKACQSRIAHDREDDDIVMPFVRSSTRTKARDQVYRDMERGSEVRAQAAADMLGVPVSDMSGLKITDLNDRQRPGDIAAPPVNNIISQTMNNNPSFGFGSAGLEYSQTVATGPWPSRGAQMRTVLQGEHGGRAGGNAVSDRPAIETMQPGYRRRG